MSFEVMAQKKLTRRRKTPGFAFSISLPFETVSALTQYQQEKGLEERSEAIRELLEAGLTHNEICIPERIRLIEEAKKEHGDSVGPEGHQTDEPNVPVH